MSWLVLIGLLLAINAGFAWFESKGVLKGISRRHRARLYRIAFHARDREQVRRVINDVYGKERA